MVQYSPVLSDLASSELNSECEQPRKLDRALFREIPKGGLLPEPLNRLARSPSPRKGSPGKGKGGARVVVNEFPYSPELDFLLGKLTKV